MWDHGDCLMMIDQQAGTFLSYVWHVHIEINEQTYYLSLLYELPKEETQSHADEATENHPQQPRDR